MRLIHSNHRTEFLNSSRSITHRPLPGYPQKSGPLPEKSNPLSKKRKLTEDQERQRMDGLRILARIIARHYLAHPELYPSPGDGTASAVGKDEAHGEDTA